MIQPFLENIVRRSFNHGSRKLIPVFHDPHKKDWTSPPALALRLENLVEDLCFTAASAKDKQFNYLLPHWWIRLLDHRLQLKYRESPYSAQWRTTVKPFWRPNHSQKYSIMKPKCWPQLLLAARVRRTIFGDVMSLPLSLFSATSNAISFFLKRFLS